MSIVRFKNDIVEFEVDTSEPGVGDLARLIKEGCGLQQEEKIKMKKQKQKAEREARRKRKEERKREEQKLRKQRVKARRDK